jgi:hypothetical protein
MATTSYEQAKRSVEALAPAEGRSAGGSPSIGILGWSFGSSASRGWISSGVTITSNSVLARLMVRHGIRTPDAIQLAAARISGAAWFLTNDGSIPAIPGITTILLAQLAEG